MFKIQMIHDLMNKDPSKRKKITGFQVVSGYNCNILYCKYRTKCKHVNHYRYHNFSVNFRLWIYHHTNHKVNIKFPWYFTKKHVNLSGTPKCKFNVERVYSCYDCKFSNYGGNCTNPKYINLTTAEKMDEILIHRCKFIEPDDYALNYDKNTGEIKYN